MHARMIRAIVIGLLFLALSLSSVCGEAKIDQEIERLLRVSLDIQYGLNDKVEIREIFTDRFLRNIDKYFYKIDKAPFAIMNIIEIERYLLYNIRIRDKAGEYIQDVTVVRIEDKYRIDEILYDI